MRTFGQIDTSGIEQKKYKMLYFYTFGLICSLDGENGNKFYKCDLELKKKYGFGYIRKAGCVVRTRQLRRWTRHNKMVEIRLTLRHGKNWYQKYEAELNQCAR
jgi:hypothetical protein